MQTARNYLYQPLVTTNAHHTQIAHPAFGGRVTCCCTHDFDQIDRPATVVAFPRSSRSSRSADQLNARLPCTKISRFSNVSSYDDAMELLRDPPRNLFRWRDLDLPLAVLAGAELVWVFAIKERAQQVKPRSKW